MQQLSDKVDELQKIVIRLQEETEELKEETDQILRNQREPSLISCAAMLTLENYVVLQIMAAKTQMRKHCIYDFDDLKRVGKEGEISQYLPVHYQELIRYYKKQN